MSTGIQEIRLTPTQAYALCMRVGGGAYSHPAAQTARHYTIASVRRLIALGLLEVRGKNNVRENIWEAAPTAAGRAWALAGAAC